MVVRVWKARATVEGAAGYLRHFEAVVRPELSGLSGFQGAVLLQRAIGDQVEIAVETRWRSMAAIAAFAGDDVDGAVVEPGARAVLSQFDDHVVHYEIVTEIAGSDDPRTGETTA